MSATMALRTSAPPARRRASSRAPADRVATMFRTAGPDAERKLGDAMVAAAGKFGAKHQMRSGRPSARTPRPRRRAFLKKALLGVRAHADPRAITRRDPRHPQKQPTRGGICLSHVWRACFRSPALPSLTADVPPVPPVSPIVQQAAARCPPPPPTPRTTRASPPPACPTPASWCVSARRRPSVTTRWQFVNRRGAIRRRALGFVPKNRGLFSRVFSLPFEGSETPHTQTRL